MDNNVTRTIERLKTVGFTGLLALPPYSDEVVRSGRAKKKIGIWKEQESSDRLKIVVQAYRHYFLGIGRMYAMGFVIDSNDRTTDLTPEQIYEYS